MSLTLHSAPGSNAGFTFQFERALFWLAQSPAGFIIGIETDDDVAIRASDGSRILEQDKNSIRDNGKPFGNRSNDLWNTLDVWLSALEAGEVEIETSRFLMVTNKTLPECIAHQIGRASSDADVEACVGALEIVAKDPPRHIAEKVLRVMRADSRPTLKNLLKHCEMIDGSQGSAGPELRNQTTNHLQIPIWWVPQSDSITDELLGWLNKVALAAWQENRPAWIERDNFVSQFHAILDRRRRQQTRERAEHLIPVSDDSVGSRRSNRFVRQLYLITEDDTIVVGAIRDFIRCNIEKIRLSEEGNITDDDWRAFQVALQSRWTRIRARVERMHRETPENDRGFTTFTECTENHRERLAGSDTDQVYLTAGTFHLLADMLEIGWHPSFQTLMRNVQESQ